MWGGYREFYKIKSDTSYVSKEIIVTTYNIKQQAETYIFPYNV
jgi:hypothetical protein